MGDHHGSSRKHHSSRAVEQGKIVGQKPPLKLKDIWALRVRLQMEGRMRELAQLNLGIESKLALKSMTLWKSLSRLRSEGVNGVRMAISLGRAQQVALTLMTRIVQLW